MELVWSEAREVLRRTPATLDAMLRGLPEAFVRLDEGPDTWSPFDVVGHLIDGEETDWVPRTRIILEHGPARPFDPYDRFSHLARKASETLAGRLDRFAELRAANLVTIDAMKLGPADLAREGRHPALGPVTLGMLLATWVTHDLDHVTQIARTIAKGYRKEAGPWVEYIKVLRQ
jgi:hypothetical protein